MNSPKVKTNAKGRFFIFVSPSGGGKTTLIKKLLESLPQLIPSVSHTTRQARQGEKDGTHYFFTSVEDFLKKRDGGEFLEWAEVYGNYYGTHQEFIANHINQNHFVITDLDVQGADQVKKVLPQHALVFFIAPPSFEELQRRLESRGTDDPHIMERRLEEAKKELDRQHDYDYHFINRDLEECHREICQVLQELIGATT